MVEFIKALIRPYLILWATTVWCVAYFSNMAIPEVLTWILGIMIVEYFGERAVKRLKENGKR